MALLESTQQLLHAAIASGMNPRQIADLSQGRVNHEWLKKYAAGKIDDPGVSRIQALHDTLLAIKSTHLIADGSVQ